MTLNSHFRSTATEKEMNTSTLGLSMIVRDAEATLARCLTSANALVNEMVIADTGSKDQTREIAAQHGARVISIPWENDFAKTRNRALREVQTDWVLVLDADEVLDPLAAQVIPDLLSRSTVAGYQVPIRNYVLTLNQTLWDRPAKPNNSDLPAARDYPAYVQHENVRLFRRMPEIFFEGRVHETVGSRILAAGLQLNDANFCIHHFGLTADRETRQGKNKLYRDLGRQKLRERPDDPQAHFELGMEELEDFQDAAAALPYFQRASELNLRFSLGWTFSGIALLRLRRDREAIECLKRAEESGPKTALVAETLGDAYYNLGDFEAARRHYRRAEDRAGQSATLESKLGLSEVRLGRISAGLERLRSALTDGQGFAEVYDRLITACISLQRLEEAAETAEAKLEAVNPQPEWFLRAASIRAQLRDFDGTDRLLIQGLKQFPAAEGLSHALSELRALKGSMSAC